MGEYERERKRERERRENRGEGQVKRDKRIIKQHFGDPE